MQKILMITMGLDIGGAETHIVELSKELKRRGYEVIIASNGGVYVQEINAFGIRHVEIPMNVRTVSAMAKSYKLLKKLIREEKPDIVHAHARIPAFIAGLVRKRVKFNFVTSAHGVFDTTGALKYLTNWGDRVIAVSEDIREYLINNYGISGQKIKVSVNGIDTQKFSADTDFSRAAAEFKIDTESPVICHVSRLDEETVLMAERLLDGMKRLDAEIPGVQLIIAGGGTQEERLRARASAINDELGRRAVLITGARTDINEIVAMCDVFVGVSRTALEAMSCEKPVILAGNAGYTGLFGKEQLAEAKSDNFCCRVRGHSSNDDIISDIIETFGMLGTDKIKEMCEFGRELIRSDYSVSRMAQDCIDVYNKAVQTPRKILMSGYYGFQNAGDDAILSIVSKKLLQTDANIEIKALINNPEKTGKSYDFETADRFNVIEILKSVRWCDVLLSGGGSLLQDVTSTKSVIYYVTLINIAKLMGKKVMIYANGIGPIIKPSNRKRVKAAVNRVDVITLREGESEEYLREMGVKRGDIHITADPVFMLSGAPCGKAKPLLGEAEIPADKPYIIVSLRKWKNTQAYTKATAEICDEIYARYDRNIVFLPMNLPDDIQISRAVMKKMKSPSFILAKRYTTEQYLSIFGGADFVIGMRLHAIIFAATMNVPAMGVSYDPKVEYHLRAFGMPLLGNTENLKANTALKSVEKVVKNRDSYVKKIAEKTEIMKQRSEKNEEFLMELLESK